MTFHCLAHRQYTSRAGRAAYLPLSTTLVLLCLLFGASFARATDLVRIRDTQSGYDPADSYLKALLELALNETRESDGDFEIVTVPSLPRERGFIELMQNRLINVTEAPANPRLENHSRAIFFPTRKGYYSYRVLLINAANVDTFAAIDSIAQLKRLRAGSHTQWTTSEVLRRQDFMVVESTNYIGLFGMLMHNRIDFFPRSINEADNELDYWSKTYPRMIREQSILLHIPTANYIYVSPNNEKLAARIEAGLWKSFYSGTFNRLFRQYHNVDELKQMLNQRKVFHIDNPLLTKHEIFDRAELWIDVDSVQH